MEEDATLNKMSKQAPHATVMIPGPIEFDDAVLESMSHYSQSHISPAFIATFSETLQLLRKLFQTTSPASQPFVLSGSGTLGWDLVAANLTAPGDAVLVLHTGYFADSFATCFETYGVQATQLRAPIGARPSLHEVETALRQRQYALITVTHVDTSTGVLSELASLASLVQRISPETLLIVDGVCSVGCEEIRFDDWGLDAVITASQKAIGCPAGLSISMFSGRAIETFKRRKVPPGSYYASMANWIPIMQAYEARQASYFATPSPQLIHALHTSLTQILAPRSSPSPSSTAQPAATTAQVLSDRFARHHAVSLRVKKAIADLGLQQLATDPTNQANGMTAFYLPEGIGAAALLPKLAARDVVLAGGLHKDIKTRYARIGHMGVSVMDPSRTDIEKTIAALREALKELGYAP